MIERIAKILAAFTEADLTNITEKTELINDLGLNSLDLVNIVVEFEEEFDIEVPDKKIKNFVTIGDVTKYLKTECGIAEQSI